MKKTILDFTITFLENLLKTSIVILSCLACISVFGIAWGILGYMMTIFFSIPTVGILMTIGFSVTLIVFLVTVANIYF